MEQSKALAKAMKAQKLVPTKWVPMCDDLDCQVCKMPLGSKQPQNWNKPKNKYWKPKEDSGT